MALHCHRSAPVRVRPLAAEGQQEDERAPQLANLLPAVGEDVIFDLPTIISVPEGEEEDAGTPSPFGVPWETIYDIVLDDCIRRQLAEDLDETKWLWPYDRRLLDAALDRDDPYTLMDFTRNDPWLIDPYWPFRPSTWQPGGRGVFGGPDEPPYDDYPPEPLTTAERYYDEFGTFVREYSFDGHLVFLFKGTVGRTDLGCHAPRTIARGDGFQGYPPIEEETLKRLTTMKKGEYSQKNLWEKRKGVGIVIDPACGGCLRYADIHWYEYNRRGRRQGIRVEMKIKSLGGYANKA